MTNAMATRQEGVLEQVIVNGDLSKLAPGERMQYYRSVCESLGLNPLTKPFAYITLHGRLTLYALRDATDQLRASRGISVAITSREFLADAGLYVVIARAVAKDGRTDESVGAVSVKGLQGEEMANALMKAETKAKRRVTLSVAGLGWLDETEAGSVPGAHAAEVDTDTGEIHAPAPRQVAAGWTTKELGGLLSEAALSAADLAAVLGEPVHRENVIELVNAWLTENPGKAIQDLVREAVNALVPAAEGEAVR
jgi:hypothetical protein